VAFAIVDGGFCTFCSPMKNVRWQRHLAETLQQLGGRTWEARPGQPMSIGTTHQLNSQGTRLDSNRFAFKQFPPRLAQELPKTARLLAEKQALPFAASAFPAAEQPRW